MAQKTWIGFAGTYTKKESEGIYSFLLDTEEGKIKDVKVAGKIGNPTYLCISEDNRFLYSVAKDGDNGGVASFKIQPETRELTYINSQVSPGSPPCHVSIDTKGQYLFTSNYHKGTVELHQVNPETGEIAPASSTVQHVGSGPDHRQEKAHTHYAGFTPDEKYVVAIDLGGDAVYSYKVQDGKLEEVAKLQVKPGSGPRHIVFHPKKPSLAYLITELSSEAVVLKYDSETGEFTERQRLSLIPEDFTENNQASAIHISKDGRFLYAANRGHNSIAIFRVSEDTGLLEPVDRVSTEGDWPRDFVLDPTENFLIASNQNSGTLTLFKRTKDTGKLELLQKDVNVPEVVCLKFLHN